MRAGEHGQAPYLRHRQLEEVDYWRKRAGWFDDDEAMASYNNGVYDSYYQLDDDPRKPHASKEGAVARGLLKVLSVLVAVALVLLMFKAILRRLSNDKEKKRSESRSGSKSRSTRSRSRSRSRRTGGDGNYELLDDEKSDSRSKRSSRSKSRTRRSGRSRSRSGRSRSKSRPKHSSEGATKEAVLV